MASLQCDVVSSDQVGRSTNIQIQEGLKKEVASSLIEL